MLSIVKKFHENAKAGLDYEWALKYVVDPEFSKQYKKYIKSLERKKYYYMVTFTIDPNKVPPEMFPSAQLYIEDQVKRENVLKIEEYEYVVEYTQQGIPHYHVSIVTTKPLFKNRFQYYTKKYGHVDISRSKQTSTQEALNYMSKVGIPIKLR